MAKLPPIKKDHDKWSSLNYQGNPYRLDIKRGVPVQAGCIVDGETKYAELEKRDGYWAGDFEHTSIYVRKDKDAETHATIFWLSFGQSQSSNAGLDQLGF